jgi:DNA-binding beta-propeller fold protein YncE
MLVASLQQENWQQLSYAGSLAISPDGHTMYIGSRPAAGGEPGASMNTISVLALGSSSEPTSFSTGHQFSTLALSKDGTRLYTVNASEKSITVFSRVTMKELRTISNVGTMPAFVIVRP